MLLAVAMVLAAAAFLLLWRRPLLLAERIAQPTATPVASSYDQTVVTREVTLEEAVWYTIQTGVFSSEEAASEKAGAYADRGAPGTVVEENGKWRVFIASYGTEADASAVRQRLGETQRVETYLYAWRCDELRLRLKGMAGQLDVAEAGLTLMMEAAVQLRDTAILLDAAQLTSEEALKVVREVDGQISLWAQTARERFGRQTPQLVQQLLALTDSWKARCKALEAAAATATTLSAELKGQGMQMYKDMIVLRSSFSGE